MANLCPPSPAPTQHKQDWKRKRKRKEGRSGLPTHEFIFAHSNERRDAGSNLSRRAELRGNGTHGLGRGEVEEEEEVG